ncbi:hypothetical protein LTR85_009161 [Meristemomyces frigidus]|nr:hypothetical protein LTR85_009161 [Meristemomyces frigidus]
MASKTYDAKAMQDHVNNQAEPAYKTRIINSLNEHSAKSRTGVALRLPQPSPVGHCLFSLHPWTEEQSELFARDGTLPRDLTNMDQEAKCIVLWVFDATAAGGQLPELELDPVPNLKKHPALCAFDMDAKETISLVPSEFLELIPTGKNKVRFVLKDRRLEDCTVDRCLKA